MSRGPAYPYINLADAVALSRKLFDFTKRAPANLNAVLKDKWEYSPTSSSAVKVVAALKYYGLIELVPGANKDAPESIRVSDRSYRILVDTDGSSERAKALRDACLSPKAYKLCWDTWGRELPDSMRSTLIFGHGFNDSTVDIFLTNYKKSIQFAGLLEPDSVTNRVDERPDEKKNAPKIGDYVQWKHDGVLGFPKALRLVKFSDDGAYAWVEGHSTGLPLNELIAAEPPLNVVDKDTGSRVMAVPAGQVGISGQAPRAPVAKGTGMRQETIALEEGDAVLQWPESIGKDSITDVEDWMKFLLKRLRRSVGEGAAAQQPQADNSKE